MGEVVFGYQTVRDVPNCPCNDPGNYLMAEKTSDPLILMLRCWCGSTNRVEFENLEELKDWVTKQKGG